MIRLVQRKLILPRGDTGGFSIPVLPTFDTGDIAVFSIFNPLNKTYIFKKKIEIENQKITITFSHDETVNLPCGKYVWDIKTYKNPIQADGEVVGGDEVHSYYAGHTLPQCQIRETSDAYLLADDAPTSTLTPNQLNIITAALAELRDGIAKTQENVTHYPTIIDNYWHVWDVETSTFVNTEVFASSALIPGTAPGSSKTPNYEYESGLYTLASQQIASGIGSNATGINTTAFGDGSHAEGNNTIASGENSHTEGTNSQANNNSSHAEGFSTRANGTYSHAQGYYTIAAGNSQHVSGKYNIEDLNNLYAQIVGIGTYNNNRLNGYTLDWDGNGWYAGKVSVGNIIPTNNNDLTTKNYVDTNLNLKANLSDIPINNSELINDSGYLTAQDITGKQDILTFDLVPTVNSLNPVTSNGIYQTITSIKNDINDTKNTIVDSNFTIVQTGAKWSIGNWVTINGTSGTSNKRIRTISNSFTGLNYYVKADDGIKFFVVFYGQNDIYIARNEYPWVTQSYIPAIAPQGATDFRLVVKTDSEDVLTYIVDSTASKVHFFKEKKQDILTFDSTPTSGSLNPVTSDGIYNAITNINTMKIHVCSNNEYNSSTGIPTIISPDTETFYLVPGGENNNLYIEWVYVNNAWQQFGSATIDLSDYALKAEIPENVSELNNDAGYLTQHQDISGKQDTLTFDEVPTANSRNPVRSGGVKLLIDAIANTIPRKVSDLTDDSGHYTKPSGGIPASDIASGVIPDISVKQDILTFDITPTLESNNPVTSNGIRQAMNVAYSQITGETDLKLLNKQNTLTFDTVPTTNSENPVTSSGIKTALDLKADASNIPTKVSDLTNDAEYITNNSFIPTPLIVSISKTSRCIAYNNGTLGQTQNFNATDYVSIENWQAIRYKRSKSSSTSSTVGMAFYNNEKQYISGVRALLNQDSFGYYGLYDVTVPENAVYARFSMLADTETYGDFELYGLNKLVVQVTNKADISSLSTVATTGDYSDLNNTPTIPSKVSDLDNDSGYLTSHQDITGKTDKVANATNGNFAALDTNGNLTDSGSKASDFLTTHQDISGKADKVISATNGNFAALDSNGNLADSGHKHSDYLTSHQDISGKADKVTSATNGNFAALDANGNLTDSGSKASDFLTSHQTIPVTDVQVNGTSVLSQGVANIPTAASGNPGTVKVNPDATYGLVMSSGEIRTYPAGDNIIKTGTNDYAPIVPGTQHKAVFYGLAKAAGDSTQASSSNAVGTYTDGAKNAIKSMLDCGVITETVSGTDPVITGVANHRYVCSECYTLSVTPPASGTIEVMFESGTTATVLTLPNTVKMPDWWGGVEASRTYDLIIMDGVYGAVASWT